MNRSAFLVSAFLVVFVAAGTCFAQPPTADVYLLKHADGAGGTLFEFQVTDLAAPFWLGDHGSADLHLMLHDNDIVEWPTPGWLLSDIQVTGIPYDLIPNGVTVHVDSIYGVPSVTFVNEPVPAVPAPGAILLGTLGLSVAGWRLRRRTL